MESTSFVYDGISSLDMKVTKVSAGSGLFEETFLANKVIREDKIRGNDTPYHYGVDRDTLVIPVSIWVNEDVTEEEFEELARWIDQNYYKELYFNSKPDKRFYAMLEGDSSRLHNGIIKGRIDLQFRTNSPYCFSPVYVSEIYNLSTNPTGGTEILYINRGDIPVKPILNFEMVGNGDIRIVNKSDGDREFKMTGLINGERITVDNHYEEIESDAIGTYRYDNHNNVFLELPRGHNYLQVYGKVKDLKFTSQFNTKI